jgi:hypothetical protein
MKMTAFWNIALCSLVEVDRRFRGVEGPLIALMMEAMIISETSVNVHETTRRSIPEGCHLHGLENPRWPLLLKAASGTLDSVPYL